MSRNRLAPCKARAKHGLKPLLQCHSSILRPVRGAEALRDPQVPFRCLFWGLPCSPCLRGPAVLWAPGWVSSCGGDSRSRVLYRLWQGGDFPVMLLWLPIPRQPAKGVVGRLMGISFPTCDCWSGCGEIKNSSPVTIYLPGLIFIS